MAKTDYPVNRIKRRRITGLLTCLLLLLMCGCGTRSPEAQYSDTAKQAEYGNGAIPTGTADKSMQLSLAGTDIQFDRSAADAPVLDRKIIQNANLSLKVKEVPAAVEKILMLNKQSGGYTVSSHIYKNNEQISAELSIKVPQQKLSDVITGISAFGELTDKVITTEDVTEEYYDAEARLKVLQAKEERLLNLMEKAASIEDIIKIENELSQTRSEIEVLSGRLKYLTNATDYSLVNITLKQAVGGAVKTPQGTWGKSLQGLINSLNQLIHLGSSLIVGFFIILPWVIILALLFLLLRTFYLKRKNQTPRE